MLIRIPKGWEIPEREATPESVYLNRRQILAAAGFLGTAALLKAGDSPYPAKRNPEFTLDRPITEEAAAAGYNNFYEFDANNKEAVKDKVGKFTISPWKVDVVGLVNKPATFELDDLVRTMPLEERLYRHRCVERWSMAIPWTGFPLSELIKKVDPKPEAKFIRFVTAERPKEMPGLASAPWYPWPYQEGLRMDEAMNPLAILTTGMYGKPLYKQNGAPIRMIVPWKYGYKSGKSIVKIEFVKKQPSTLWNTLQPGEYGFYSNVNPNKPHPRWSQQIEQFIPTMERKKTLLYNGYEQWVAKLYDGKEY
jgi:sulfoxide reductase catalytic subunit YedY